MAKEKLLRRQNSEEEITSEAVIDKYADMVYRLALVQVKNQADADDIFQEVFVRLVSHIHKLESWEHIKAWLIRVTINCSKKHFSRFDNRNFTSLDDVEEKGVEEEGFEKAEGDDTVTKAVQKLPPKYRSVVHLFYFEEMSIAEIADFTGQKETTVKSQLFRAREMLKEMLEGEYIL